MAPKYQIFISSTYVDLIDERNEVMKAILTMGHIPIGMEMFSAGDEEQWQLIEHQIDDSDYYVIIVAHRYGSTTDEGISYTEKEYDYAVSKGVPVLGFVLENGAAWPSDRFEKNDENRKRLDAFKDKVRSKMIQFWKNKEDLNGKVAISLMKIFHSKPRTGWIKASEAADPNVANEIARLSKENEELRGKLAEFNDEEIEFEGLKMKLSQIKYQYAYLLKDQLSGNEDYELFEFTILDIFDYLVRDYLFSEFYGYQIVDSLREMLILVNYQINSEKIKFIDDDSIYKKIIFPLFSFGFINKGSIVNSGIVELEDQLWAISDKGLRFFNHFEYNDYYKYYETTEEK